MWAEMMAKWGVNKVCLVTSASGCRDGRWLAALLSSSAHVAAHPVWLIDRSNQMSLRALWGFPVRDSWSQRPSSAQNESSPQMGRLLARTLSPPKNRLFADDVLSPLSELRSVLKDWNTLLHPPCKSSCHGCVSHAFAASWGNLD